MPFGPSDRDRRSVGSNRGRASATVRSVDLGQRQSPRQATSLRGGRFDVTDTSQDPGWWQVSNAEWFPPKADLMVAPNWHQGEQGEWLQRRCLLRRPVRFAISPVRFVGPNRVEEAHDSTSCDRPNRADQQGPVTGSRPALCVRPIREQAVSDRSRSDLRQWSVQSNGPHSPRRQNRSDLLRPRRLRHTISHRPNSWGRGGSPGCTSHFPSPSGQPPTQPNV